MSAAEEETRLQYQQLVNEYGAALVAKDAPRAKELLIRATVVWEQLRTFGGLESHLDTDAHLVTALQFAIEAGDAQEAHRLYASMSKQYQAIISGDGNNKTLMAWLATGE